MEFHFLNGEILSAPMSTSALTRTTHQRMGELQKLVGLPEDSQVPDPSGAIKFTICVLFS